MKRLWFILQHILRLLGLLCITFKYSYIKRMSAKSHGLSDKMFAEWCTYLQNVCWMTYVSLKISGEWRTYLQSVCWMTHVFKNIWRNDAHAFKMFAEWRMCFKISGEWRTCLQNICWMTHVSLKIPGEWHTSSKCLLNDTYVFKNTWRMTHVFKMFAEWRTCL
jgi:hypothetical protein